MNKHQKLVQKQFLNNEEAVIKRLKQVYGKSLEDVTKQSEKLQKEFEELSAIYDTVEDEAEREILKSRMRSKVYQKKYQDSLKTQISGILDNMHENSYKTVSDYLEKCYEDGFIGTMFDLQGQGIPLCMPLDQKAMVRAVQTDSKISKGLYNHLGEDVDMLKKHITAQISRGISTGMTTNQIARNLAAKMTGNYKNAGGSLAYAQRIARTEGHRIQCQGTMDAMYGAKEKGADVVKQWDSTLDARTRDSHARVDGEIRELDKKFSNGLMFPGDSSGGAAEVVNCRCALLQRARWALDDDELNTLKDRAAYYGLDKAEQFDDFKKKYMKAANDGGIMPVLTNNGKSDIIYQGAKYGAYNDTNDPEGRKRKAHAELYYEEIRNSSTESFVNSVSKNADIPKETVEKAYKHIFVDDNGFVEDYDMAESFRRLRTNDNIQEHDRILVLHEALEYEIMKNNPNMPYTQAHGITEQSYNYAKALLDWKKKGGK